MIALSHAPLDASAVAAAVADGEHGATVVFAGTTRAESAAREVVALEYEAFAEMALDSMRAIAAAVAHRHGARVAIVHRLGRVAVGEDAVVAAASAPHRAAAFAACAEAMNLLKADVPIWKRTIHADGGTRWDDGVAGALTAGG